MRKEKEKKRSNHIAIILIGVICGLVMFPFLDSISTDLGLWIPLLDLYLILFLQLIIHEAGHLVFGLFTGYHFLSFRIGNFMWVMEDGKLKYRRMSIAGTSGQCLMSPPDRVNGRIPFILYNLGGSIANLVVALLSLVGYFLFQKNAYLSLFFSWSAIVGIVFALANGIPLHLGMVDNDGANTQSLRKSQKALDSFWVQMKVMEYFTKGQRLRDMPESWFYLPNEDEMKNSMTAVMAVFCENRSMDRQLFEEVEKVVDKLETMDTAIVGIHRCLLTCDRLYCELIRGKNSEKINQLRTKEQVQFMKKMRKSPAVIRTEYAYALLYEKNTNKAEQLKNQFEKCASSYPYVGEIESERELLQIVESISQK
jgi:hypothetical protein